jgi:hypothetical protein
VLVRISKELWLWCLQRGIILRAQHLPGKENPDFMSCHLRDRTLNPALMWGPLEVELFATRSRDAFSQDWRGLWAYAHLQWCLISRVLAKALSQEVMMVLVRPCRPTQTWFPQLIEMLA